MEDTSPLQRLLVHPRVSGSCCFLTGRLMAAELLRRGLFPNGQDRFRARRTEVPEESSSSRAHCRDPELLLPTLSARTLAGQRSARAAGRSQNTPPWPLNLLGLLPLFPHIALQINKGSDHQQKTTVRPDKITKGLYKRSLKTPKLYFLSPSVET